MRVFLAILLRCALAFGLALAPVANALDMAAMESGKEDMPSCHTPDQPQQTPDSGHAASQCHCAMAICLPASAPAATHSGHQSDHPQTVQRLALGLTSTPEIPPPQPLS
ncbi:MAG: hypothetical protein Q8O33_16335 [Pseudomonadota bacterium]|nr:hypothetical protein [Pseudomonadota bacterium]